MCLFIELFKVTITESEHFFIFQLFFVVIKIKKEEPAKQLLGIRRQNDPKVFREAWAFFRLTRIKTDAKVKKVGFGGGEFLSFGFFHEQAYGDKKSGKNSVNATCSN